MTSTYTHLPFFLFLSLPLSLLNGNVVTINPSQIWSLSSDLHRSDEGMNI